MRLEKFIISTDWKQALINDTFASCLSVLEERQNAVPCVCVCLRGWGGLQQLQGSPCAFLNMCMYGHACILVCERGE